MKIPEEVNILYKTYTVNESFSLHEGADELYGRIHFLQQQIELNAEISEEQKKSTLIHEIIHALDEMYIIGLEETQVEKLGNAVYMFIRDNPKMFEMPKSSGETDD